MIRNILQKDLKRKRTMNIIILLFVILATLFVASSVSNIVTVMNGTGYYFEQAGLGDYTIMSMGERSGDGFESVLRKIPEVKEYRIDEVIYASQDAFTANGESVTCRNVVMMQSLEDAQLKFFDEDNRVVDSVEPGRAYVTSDFLKRNHLSVGDQLTIQHNSVNVTLTIAGRLKDAMFGSTFMGNVRILMSAEDFAGFQEDEVIRQYYRGQICYIDTDNPKALSSQMGDVEGIAFDGPASMIRMCYVMDMVIAGVLIVVSICLILVSFVVLKFTITFTLQEEFREIGVMKAIGIKNRRIRSIYLIKYLALAIVGAGIGLAGSIPFANMLLKSVSENMVLGSDNTVWLNVISVCVVVLVIVGYAYRCTGKLKKYAPMDAIRSGQTGERFRKKSIYRLGRSHLKPSGYMAVNDVLSSPKRYLTIVLAFSICAMLVFILVNTTETMKSDRLAYTFGKVSDAYYTDVNASMKNMHGEGHAVMEQKLDELEDILAENGMPAKASVEAWYKYKVSFGDVEYKITCMQGIRTRITDYVYSKGTVPRNAHEIAITEQIADKIGAGIGDTVQITIGDVTDSYMITAYFQSMNQMGEVIRIHEEVPTDLRDCSGLMSFQFDFTDHPSQREIDRRVEEMKRIFDIDTVFNAAEYSVDCIGVVGMMESVGFLLLGITLLVVILVSILMERSFISDEKNEIAILKAVGFRDACIIGWHVKRMLLVSLVAVAIAVALAVPMTKLCITPIFGMMGLKHLQYEINPWKVCLIYPGIILGATVITTYLTARYTKKINPSDTASIE